MQLMPLLHKLFKKGLPHFHKSRLSNVLLACEAALKSNKLCVTGLGRGLANRNKVSSNIQKMDRLVGNEHLQAERNVYYKVMMDQLIPAGSQPWIHVDWSCINSTTNLYVLRAILSLSGRSIVIYEACYPKKQENNAKIHKRFLEELKKLLRPSVKPIIVTDGGFRAPWFKEVLNLEWDFVGRLRNKNLVQLEGSELWQLSAYFLSKPEKCRLT